MLSDDCRILIVGRTNVGKSTLFNRLVRSRDAITFDRHGVTRDAREKIAYIYEREVILIDSPGMFDYAEYNSDQSLLVALNKKLAGLVNSADLIIFVLDGITGITTYDRDIANVIRKTGKKVIVAVNKSERKGTEHSYIAATEFGFSEVHRISAEHGLGIDSLLEAISENIPEADGGVKPGLNDGTNEDAIRLAIIGRPNVGKSTMINSILGEEKQIVADYSGLTRESAEFIFQHGNKAFKLVDTAGIRRKNRVCDILEKISVLNARQSYRNADAVILMIDAMTLKAGKIDKQDLALAADILKHGKALVIAFNKVDKTPYKSNESSRFLKRYFKKSLSQLKEVPFLFTSALYRENIEKMLQMIISTYDSQKTKIKTSDLNEWLREVGRSGLMQSSSVRLKLKYITQVGVLPPKFLIFVTRGDSLREDHKRFIINSFRETFNIQNVAVNIIFRNTPSKSSPQPNFIKS